MEGCCLLLRSARRLTGSWGRGHRRWAQNLELTGPSLSGCDLVEGEENGDEEKDSVFENVAWKFKDWEVEADSEKPCCVLRNSQQTSVTTLSLCLSKLLKLLHGNQESFLLLFYDYDSQLQTHRKANPETFKETCFAEWFLRTLVSQKHILEDENYSKETTDKTKDPFGSWLDP